MKKILLGSQSPRRRELLASLGYDFEVVHIDCEENFPSNIEIKNVAGYLSELKARAFREIENHEILLTADTIVSIDNQILGKPKDKQEAKQMLKLISGKKHRVYTAISFRTSEKIITETDVAEVELLPLDEAEISHYIKTCQPMDKAGAYGIQDWLGMTKISKIQGNFYTIMGLPTTMVYQFLKNIEK